MLHESLQTHPPTKSNLNEIPHIHGVKKQEETAQQLDAHCEPLLDRLPEKSQFWSHQVTNEMQESEATMEKDLTAGGPGASLYQEGFFFCTIKKIGDISGPRCIYVETVVDRDSGMAFAKVYSAKNALNAVDILASRAAPFFDRRRIAIREIHTRGTSEYCGMLLAHPFETFLANSRIRHLPMDQPGHPCNDLCEEFYRHLLKNFFLPSLRKTRQISLEKLQKDLDAFVTAYNSRQMKHERNLNDGAGTSANFPVHS
jgi:hypothetical protein